MTERKWKDREGQGSIVPAMKGRRQNTLRDSSVYIEAKEDFTTYKMAKKKTPRCFLALSLKKKELERRLLAALMSMCFFFSPILSATDS